MDISVVYAGELAQAWIEISVAEDCTIEGAIERSGILIQFPEINLEYSKVGVYGKFAKLDASLQPGDRIEIYRPITKVLDDDDDNDEDDD